MVDPSEWIWVTLLPKRVAFCEHEALLVTDRRCEGKHRNNLEKDYERDLARMKRAMCAEGALMIYFSRQGVPVFWDLGLEAGHPDINGHVDAKCVPDFERRLLLYVDANEEELRREYVLICSAEHPRYCIMGWQSGHEIKRLGVFSELQPKRYSYALDHQHLRPMSELLPRVAQSSFVLFRE
jgi:hypothetical protein